MENNYYSMRLDSRTKKIWKIYAHFTKTTVAGLIKIAVHEYITTHSIPAKSKNLRGRSFKQFLFEKAFMDESEADKILKYMVK